MKLFYTFGDKEQAYIAAVGGKGLSLIKSYSSGYNVPDGVVLTTSFFDSWTTEIRASSVKNPVELKKKCSELSFNQKQNRVLDDVRSFFNTENITLFAVRSSSPEEDLEEASFAGIYESILGVSDINLERAVQDCFSSVFNERVLSYKNSRGYDYADAKIAVIIQKQLASDISGVAFSLNPVTNYYDEMVINANFGLGDTVVDGSVSADQFIVDKISSTIIERKSGSKEFFHRLNEDGAIIKEKMHSSDSFCLTDKQILEINALTVKIEAEYDKPMDIEWAYEGDELFLLQARPITGYTILPPKMQTKPGGQKNLYLDGLLTEQGLTEAFSPLNTGVMAETTITMSKYMGIGKEFLDATTYLDAGRMYMHIGNAVKLSGKKAFVKPITAVDSHAAAVLEQTDIKPYIPKKMPKGIMGAVFKMIAGSMKTVISTLRVYRKPEDFLSYYLAENKRLGIELKEAFEREQSFESLNEAVADLNGYWLSMVSLLALMAVTMARSSIKKLLKNEDEEVTERLLYLERALPDNVTIEMGLQLFDLSQFSEIKDSDDAEDFIKKLNRGELSSEFQQKWDRFMHDFGFRGPRELDIATKRYYEKPDEIFDLLKSISENDHPELSPRKIFDEGVKKREETYTFIVEKLQRNRGKLRKFQKRYKVMECFVAYRETPKYYWIMGVDYLRKKILTIGEEWVSTGRLDKVDDVFNLHYEEIAEAEKNSSLDIGLLVRKNIEYYEQYKNSANPPVIIDSRGFIPSLKQKPANKNELLGTPVSPGIVSGPVKVLRHPGEKKIEPGDILVAIATDPGWTSLFLNAAGVLIQHGGSLQHGASVARESCKPCIVGLENITELLEDGQIVELDGSSGLIRIQVGAHRL